MRSAVETIELLKQALEKRRSYLKRRIDEIPESSSRKSGPVITQMYRGGMLNEMSTVWWLINEIESGSAHPDDLWNLEDDHLIHS